MHQCFSNIGILIEFHAGGCVFHEDLTVGVIEASFGKVASGVDIKISFIGSPVVSVCNVAVCEYANTEDQDKSKQETHDCSFFYFFHFLSPPKISSSVSG